MSPSINTRKIYVLHIRSKAKLNEFCARALVVGNIGRSMTKTRTHLGQSKYYKFFLQYVNTDDGALLNKNLNYETCTVYYCMKNYQNCSE